MNILEVCLGEKWFEQIFSECQPCLEKSVGGKYRWSTEAVSVFFVQICLELLSNEHTWSLFWCTWETIWVNCLWISALPWKFKNLLTLGENTGNQEKLRLFSLSGHAKNYYLMNIQAFLALKIPPVEINTGDQ